MLEVNMSVIVYETRVDVKCIEFGSNVVRVTSFFGGYKNNHMFFAQIKLKIKYGEIKKICFKILGRMIKLIETEELGSHKERQTDIERENMCVFERKISQVYTHYREEQL